MENIQYEWSDENWISKSKLKIMAENLLIFMRICGYRTLYNINDLEETE